MNVFHRGAAAALVACVAGCGSNGFPFRSSSRALSTATPDWPWQGAIVRSRQVTFSGRTAAGPGTLVTAATLDASLTSRTCGAPVANDHSWSCEMQLPDGGYTWTAQAATGPISAQVDFVVSTWSQPAPLIDRLPSLINDDRPVITGTVSWWLVNHGFYLEVTENGRAICIVQPISSTNWSCALPTPLAERRHVLAADVDDEDGDELTPSSNPNVFTVKTRIGDPTVAAVPTPTNAIDVPLSGTGEPQATLTASEGTNALCQTVVPASGAWVCALSGLADGSHTIVVTQEDAAGNVSASASVSFVIDRHLPSAPKLDPPVSPSNRAQVSLSGSGEPGASVSVTDSYSRLICAATVGSDSRWSCAATLDDGDYLLSATQTTPAGNRSGPSASALLSIRTLLAPLFDVLRSPTRDASPAFSGQAVAGQRVVVYLGENALCSADADASGRWSCKPAAPLPDGSYLLQARATDAAAHFSDASASRAVVIDTTPPAAPVLAQLASPTRKRRPVVSGTAEAASSVVVSDAGSGATLCSTTADTAGNFHCTPEEPLADGAHRFTATATDAAGNTSAAAQPVSVVISENVPGRPTIERPANGADVEGHRPLIGGRTDPGTAVQVSLDGVSYSAQVDGKGVWMLFPPSDLPAGTHHLEATATDAQQNTSDLSSSSFRIVEGGVARGGCASSGAPMPLLALAALLLLRPRRKKALLAAVAVAALPSLSRAAELDISLFKPAAAGDGLAATEGARPPLDGEPKLELRTWADFAVHPLSFVSETGQQRALVRSRTGEFLGAQAHLLGPLSLAVQVPLTLDVQGDLSGLPPSSRGPSTLLGGFGDLRLTPRLALLREEWAGIDLAAQASFEFPTARAQSLSGDGRVRAEGLIALGRQLGHVPGGELSLLANGYLRLRPPREFLDVKAGTEAGLRGGLGLGLRQTRAYIPRRVYLELEGRSFLRAGFAAGSSPAEWRVGGTLCPVGNLAIDVAGGGALTDGVGAPRARFLFGFGWSPAACGRGLQPALAAVAPASAVAAIAPTPVVAPPPSPPAAEPAKEPTAAEMLPLPPPLDSDGDGIPDADDACPDQPGPKDNQGCPRSIRQRVVVSATRIEILDKVLFATGRVRLDPRSNELLDQVAAVLNSHPDLLVVQIDGHTDDVGAPSRNLMLSQARAESVAAYLESKGVDSRRLRARGFGQTQPIDTNRTAQGRANNRRVGFTVLKMRARTLEAHRPADS